MTSNNNNNKITLTLFVCLLVVCVYFAVIYIYNLIIFNIYEYFDNKRNTKIKIYKSDEILDPDEYIPNDEYELGDTNMKLNID